VPCQVEETDNHKSRQGNIHHGTRDRMVVWPPLPTHWFFLPHPPQLSPPSLPCESANPPTRSRQHHPLLPLVLIHIKEDVAHSKDFPSACCTTNTHTHTQQQESLRENTSIWFTLCVA
jgi:hypothetical protein